MSRRSRLVHRSIDYHRVEWDRANRPDSLELAFAEEWEKENQPQPGLNQGHGILQNLMFSYKRLPTGEQYLFGGEFARHVVEQRDAMIAATAVQWIGTNCGRCFLEQTLKRAGYRLMYPSDVAAERWRREREERRRDAELWLERQGWRWG